MQVNPLSMGDFGELPLRQSFSADGENAMSARFCFQHWIGADSSGVSKGQHTPPAFPRETLDEQVGGQRHGH